MVSKIVISTKPVLSVFRHLKITIKHSRRFSSFVVDDNVAKALENRQPVVALESTIITHGMPFPINIETAKLVEENVRLQGAIPATIAVLNGKIHIGLSDEKLSDLAAASDLVKVSRRDLPYVLGKGLSGGTTVSATMLIAKRAGIPVFVTGGIGGVHRGVNSSFDISADLTELGRTSITVICSGVKSILDIDKTLEYLETEGVCVVAFGDSKEFPAFFTSTSGFMAPASVSSPSEAANIIFSRDQIGLENGILIAVPIPVEFEANKEQINEAIQKALVKAESMGIKGKNITPFLLEEVNEITKGKSLQANVALIKKNARIGAQIAVELSKRKGNKERIVEDPIFVRMNDPTIRSTEGSEKKPSAERPIGKHWEVVVMGGSIVDFIVTVLEDEIKMNATTHRGKIHRSFGGVARNISDCLTRLGHRPLFLSTVGDDSLGGELIRHNPDMVKEGFLPIHGKPTATYCVILDKNGNFAFGIGDMSVHQDISIQNVKPFMDDISKSKLFVMDGNAPRETIEYMFDACKDLNIPVWYETTDVKKSIRPFLRNHVPSSLRYISPNIIELDAILENLKLRKVDTRLCGKDLFESVSECCKEMLDVIPNILVTMGQHGIAAMTRGRDPIYFPPPKVDPEDIVSVSGAGDCFAAGYISGILQNLSTNQCLHLGTEAAKLSLLDFPAVPESITPNLSKPR
ncbi:uncharacterized protein LOC136032096 isoform X1 [Artemia franciscana]|uniref:Carbohydrate kinase PfkB domain-containing protein n=2 Tax=Artemia franciscana TaxID=6661 RepID=A0AA88IRY2_ARTSF|nr:hypothetical protein QYM36_000853 [Artemia franciscana]